jgi:glycosyltransferase involved in cell wall biosynthesis
MEKILIISDAWEPQVNGVVRTLQSIISNLKKMNLQVDLITPNMFKTFKAPGYPEIDIAIPDSQIDNVIMSGDHDYIHIATEGPLGLFARRACKKYKKKFTTSYHTKFPEYLQRYFKIPTWLTYPYFKWFHNGGNGVFCATPSLIKELRDKKFKNIIPWTRGVDLSLFKPKNKFVPNKPPILLYVGRVSKEKNIEAFLDIDIESTKIVVGSGPELEKLKRIYPEVNFVGEKKGENLVWYYQNADCFVFPSKSDTFGLVIIEALACGCPVAAYPVTGPVDILTDKTGAMFMSSLSLAVKNALKRNRKDCVEEAKKYTWENTTRIFLQGLVRA